MTGEKIFKAAEAHAYKESDRDVITRNLTVPLLNLGIAELTAAENAYRRNDPLYMRPPRDLDDPNSVTLITYPAFVTKPEDDVPYCYEITTVLLPLWLCWKIFEGLDDDARAQYYRSLFEQTRDERVPVVFEQMHDRNGVFV